MNRFQRDDFYEEIDELCEQVKSDYIKSVQDDFFEKTQKEYNKYKLFRNKELLIDLFQSSIFYSLIMEDPIFVMEHDMTYWVDHIIDEINNMVDFEKLEMNELEGVKEENQNPQVLEKDKELQKLIQGIDFDVVVEKMFINDYLTRDFVQPNYIKHKKKFIKEQGVSSQATVSLSNITVGFSNQVFGVVPTKISNTISPDWDQEKVDWSIFDFFETSKDKVPSQSVYVEGCSKKEDCIDNSLRNELFTIGGY
ncbi:hypothetical protein COL72_11235 [Bacillus toyonensis]|uniref:hypothetical protein n=1 Tax=Bacillus toyonensis TaxID=155322 RepID=UPI000BF3928B|nr:hypothetical protein [Bacillus toyonensis]PFZ72402.1 hypothetical protein COL72_11235 [Bacillus toyonensis]